MLLLLLDLVFLFLPFPHQPQRFGHVGLGLAFRHQVHSLSLQLDRPFEVWPWLGDLARLERARVDAWHAGDAPVATLDTASVGGTTSKHYHQVQLVGFGIASFDWPWLLTRSAALRILPPRRFRISRYDPVATDVLDWQDVLANYDSSKKAGWTLRRYAETFGLPVPIGEGKDVPRLMAEGKTAEVIAHCHSDLLTTAALDQMFRQVFIG